MANNNNNKRVFLWLHCSGPCLMLVLSRADAVTTWKRTVGPTDPEAAREQAPQSLVTYFSAVFDL